MEEPRFKVKLTLAAEEDLRKALKKNPAKREKVKRARDRLGKHGPEYPSFRTHQMKGLKAGADPIFISYVENNTPGAWRIHWSWWGDDTITVLYIGPHT